MATYYVYDGQTYSSLKEVSKTVQAKHARAIMSVGQPTASHTPLIDHQCTLTDMAEQLTQQNSAVQQLHQAVESQCRPAASVKLYDHFAVGQQLHQQPHSGVSFRALSVHGLTVELLRDVKANELSDDALVHDLLEPVLLAKGKALKCPRDGHMGTAYVDAVQGDDKVGRATHMLSYTWGYKILDIVVTITNWCERSGLDHKTTYVWVCCTCINQHRVLEKRQRGETVPFEVFHEEFGQRVNGIGRVLALMSPWSAPGYIERSWCIFELFTAEKSGTCTVEILMPPSEEHLFQEALLAGTSMDDCWKLFTGIRLAAARATQEEDKRNIDELVMETIGFDRLDSLVRSRLQEWFVATADSLIRRTLHGLNCNPDCARACVEVGFMLERTGGKHFVRAIELYRAGLGLLAESGRLNSVIGAKILTKLGSIKRRRGEVDGALSTYQEAKSILNSSTSLTEDLDGLNALATLYSEMGTAFWKNSKVDLAMEHFQQARKIREQAGSLNCLESAVLMTQMGSFLGAGDGLRDSEEAVRVLKEGWSILQKTNNTHIPLGSNLLSVWANNLRKLGDLSGALERLEQAKQILASTGSIVTNSGAGMYAALGEIQSERGDLADALESFTESCRIREAIETQMSTEGAKSLMGKG